MNKAEFWTQAVLALIAVAAAVLFAGEWAGLWNVMPARTDAHYDRG